MTIEFMRDLLSKDEKITVEYKTCQYGIQEDVYETVCSFSNRYIPLNRIAADEATEQKKLSEREQKIYNMICENLHLSVEQVMAELDISRATVFRDYAKIKKVTGAVYDKKTSTWTL